MKRFRNSIINQHALESCLALIILTHIFCCAKKEQVVTKIGVILPLTGEMAKYGETISNAAILAADEINHKENAGKIRIKLIFEDSRINPAVGVSAARKLINADKVSAIIGPFASSVTLAVAPIAEASGVVLLSPGSSAPKISAAGDFIFRNALSDIYEGGEMAKFAYHNLGLRKIAVMYINNDFGLGLKEVFVNTLSKMGKDVVAVESYEQESRDFRIQLSRIKAYYAQATYLIGYEEMIVIFRQAQELGFETQWLATTMLNDQILVDKIGAGPADGTIFTAWEYTPGSPNPRIKEFVTKFRARTGGMDPDVFAANTYDALYLLYEAITKKGTSRSSIKDGLYEIKGFQGITGETTFDRNGDVVKPITYKTIIRGKIIHYKK